MCRSGRIPAERFFNIFTPLTLGPFSPTEAEEFIRRSSEKAECPLAPLAGQILAITGLWPFFIQIGCSKVYERMADHADTAELLRLAGNDFAQEAGQQFPTLWSSLTSEEQAACQAAARGRASLESSHTQRVMAKGYVRAPDVGGIQGGEQSLLCPAFQTFVTESQAAPPKGNERTQTISAVGGQRPPLRRIGMYDILHEVGRGSMGRVFKVRHRITERVSALKVLRPDLATDREFLERFYREIKTASQVGHQNIVRVEFADEADGTPYFVMEYVDGEGVDKLLKDSPSGAANAPDVGGAQDMTETASASRRIPLRLVLRIGMDIARALQELDRHGLIHRDIKPSNIILGRDGRAKLADFGLARLAAERIRLTQAGDLLGTPNYMSPEQKAGQELDIRSDIYSLGATLAHLLMGTTAFAATRNADNPSRSLEDELQRLQKENRTAGKTIDTVLKMVRPAREDRSPNPIALSGDIRCAYNALTADAADLATHTED